MRAKVGDERETAQGYACRTMLSAIWEPARGQASARSQGRMHFRAARTHRDCKEKTAEEAVHDDGRTAIKHPYGEERQSGEREEDMSQSLAAPHLTSTPNARRTELEDARAQQRLHAAQSDAHAAPEAHAALHAASVPHAVAVTSVREP
jgi:hypothetical protein